MFRDLAAPFGVAVFVPMFTNRVTSIMSGGANEILAAISSIRWLAAVEVICVVIVIVTVLLLPKIYINKGAKV